MENYKQKYSEENAPKMSRPEFQAMDPRDQARFISGGGTLFDIPASPKDRGIVRMGGREMSRDDFDKLSLQEQSDFALGKAVSEAK